MDNITNKILSQFVDDNTSEKIKFELNFQLSKTKTQINELSELVKQNLEKINNPEYLEVIEYLSVLIEITKINTEYRNNISTLCIRLKQFIKDI